MLKKICSNCPKRCLIDVYHLQNISVHWLYWHSLHNDEISTSLILIPIPLRKTREDLPNQDNDGDHQYAVSQVALFIDHQENS